MKQENNEQHLQQQQVLFDDDVVVDSGGKANTHFQEYSAEGGFSEQFTAQVVFDNDDYSPLAFDENGFDQAEKRERSDVQLNQDIAGIKGKNKAWLWRIITLLLLILVAIETYEFFVVGFVDSPIITSLYGIVLGSLAIVAGNSLWREFVGLKAFKSRQKMKIQAAELLIITQENTTAKQAETSNKRAKAFCDNISESLPCDVVFDLRADNSGEKQHWHDILTNEHNSAELMHLYSRVVLSKVDEKALNEVAKFSTEAVVLVALSPIAIIDMLIMLTRNLRMINKISGLYGLKLGYWSRIKLIKQVFVNMAYAGASELIADYGSDMLGAELLGKLSSRFAQGLGAGMLTARLGAKTMELCRPIPFEEKPRLTQVRKKIAQQIKSLINSQKN
ncbi:TIGR01620 family protein [Colwellia echini]|uniref:TIGR01620 family protein n=1 Tax=Colwellia echini TaxID=1982103 RepID=A0ABY3MZS4_9GAMM|nr:TIGR01620 family protein [Colwellia echini]